MLGCSGLSQLLQSVAASTLLLGSLSKPFWAPLLSSFSLLACSLCTQSSYTNLFDVLSSHRHPQCLHGCLCQIKRTSHHSQEDEYKEFHNLGDFSAEYLSFFSPLISSQFSKDVVSVQNDTFRPFFWELLNFDDEQLPQGWVCWTVSIRGGGVPVF